MMQQSGVSLAPNPHGVLSLAGTRWAVLLLHGFTAGPESVLPWAHALASAGATVRIPVLAGHGTNVEQLATTTAGQWRRDVQQALDALLAADYTHVAVGGLSMGGALALDAAAHREVDATFVVNPALSFFWRDQLGAWAAPLLHRFVPTVAALAGDIHKPGVPETAYDRTPVAAVGQLDLLFRSTRHALKQITSPVTLYRSLIDHVVPASSAKLLQRKIPASLLSTITLADSYHVATLDYDAELIHQHSISTLRGLVGAPRVRT